MSRRVRDSPQGRHRAGDGRGTFARSFAALGNVAYQGAQVSASVIDLKSGTPLLSIDDRVVVPTASMGRLLLLIEVSARLTENESEALTLLDKTPSDIAGAPGLWQHLQAPALPVIDVASLVAATGDITATNTLLAAVSLEAVQRRAEALGLTRTALLDNARAQRGPDDAPHMSVGSADELAWLMSALARGEVVDTVTSERVLGWMSLSTDLSLVSSAFGLDPLAHRQADHGMSLVNITGSSTGIRVEAGALRGNASSVAFAVVARFDDAELADRQRIVDAMRTVGYDILDHVS